MWQDEVVIWETTEHEWDGFGYETKVNFDDDPMYAKLLATWKKQTLGAFVRNLTTVFVSANKYIEDQNIVTGLALVLTALNLFPVNLKLIWDDEHAQKFLKLLHEDEAGDQYFYRKELESVGEIQDLIQYFISKNILSNDGDRLVIKGKVLNRAHIKQKK